MHLFATLALDRHLAAQICVPSGTSEIDALTDLLADLDLSGVFRAEFAGGPGVCRDRLLSLVFFEHVCVG